MAARKKRERQLTIRLRDDEYAALAAEADACEMALADVVRREIGRVVRKWRRAGVVPARRGAEPTAAEARPDAPEEDESRANRERRA